MLAVVRILSECCVEGLSDLILYVDIFIFFHFGSQGLPDDIAVSKQENKKVGIVFFNYLNFLLVG